MQATAATSTAATRKGDRISISISVQISGMDQAGQHFTDLVPTVNVSRNGCCLLVRRSLASGQKIYLHRTGTGEEAIGRIVGQTGMRPEGNLFGIEILNPGEDFWGIRFPLQKELEQGAGRTLLKCGVCQTAEEVALNEVEMSVFQINHELTRQCPKCSANTIWKSVPETEATATTNDTVPSGKRREQRKHARINMKTIACIGSPGPHQDIVDVQNVSRGGICFRSSRTYEHGTWVQVAVPYTPGAANIFVAGRIVRFRKISNTLTEYGVEYARTE